MLPLKKSSFILPSKQAEKTLTNIWFFEPLIGNFIAICNPFEFCTRRAFIFLKNFLIQLLYFFLTFIKFVLLLWFHYQFNTRASPDFSLSLLFSSPEIKAWRHVSFSDWLLSVFILCTFLTFSPELLNQFEPNVAHGFLGYGDLSLFK